MMLAIEACDRNPNRFASARVEAPARYSRTIFCF
jgi:hypothetical protein